MRTVLFSVAEPSGDRLAAALVTALREQGPLRAIGVAGPAMREAGVEPVARVEDVAAMGVVDVAGALPRILRARRALLEALEAGVDALVCVDAPDFHPPVIKKARALGVTVIGYVSPQVWAWRPGRVEAICRDRDALLCLFAFEPALYEAAAARHDCAVSWVGHPAVDRLPARSAVDLDRYGLLPGSRPGELDRHLPVFVDAARRVRAARPTARFTMPLAPELRARLSEISTEIPDWIEVTDEGAEALSDCRAVLTKSGTSTLELAIMGVPQVVAHAVPAVTWAIGSRLVTGVKHLALPNVLAGEEVVPEFLQDLDAENLADALLALPEQQDVDLSAHIGTGGASARAAQAVDSAIAEAGPRGAGSNGATPWGAAWVVLALAMLARVFVAQAIELAEDEAYYWVWAQDLAWGYFDHPPAIAGVIRAGTALLGDTELGVRLPGLILGGLSAALAVALARQRALAAAALSTMPLFALGGVLATPDLPLAAAWALGVWAASKERWALAGVAAGLAMLSKYTGLLLLPLLIIGAGAWRKPRAWLALLPAALVYAPNALWNLNHDAISWRFQLEHVAAAADRLGFIGAQVGLAGPVLFVAGAVWSWVAWRSEDRIERLLWWASVPVLLVAIVAGGEANWAAPAWLGITVGICRRVGAWRRAVVVGVGINLALSLLVTTHVAVTPLVNLPADPRDRLAGGRTLGESVKAWGVDDVLTSRYQEAALIHFYGGVPARALPGHSRFNHYDMAPWDPPEHALFVRTWRGLQGTPTDERGYDRSGPNTVTAYVSTPNPVVPRMVARWQVFELWRREAPDGPAPWPGAP
jgi:lipid-A-disaccharide synthase